MIVAHVDTALLAAPNNFANDADEAFEIFERLIDWAGWARCGALQPVVASDLAERLGELQSFPAYPFIEKAIADFGLEEFFRAQDMQTIVQSILTHALPQIELFGFELDEVSDVSCEPDVLEGRYPANLRSLSFRSMLNSALSQRYGNVNYSNFVASGIPAIVSERVQVAGKRAVFSGISPLNAGDDDVSGEVRLISRVDHIRSLCSAIDLWNRSSSDVALHFAIASRALELLKASGRDASFGDLSAFRIGSDFLRSAAGYQAGPGGNWGSVTLDTCARVVIDDPNLGVQLFGADRPQDGATCYRVQITTGNPALRLFLWKTANGWELANIDAKKHLTPVRGDCDRSCHIKYPSA
jgi:hypothetical protein